MLCDYDSLPETEIYNSKAKENAVWVLVEIVRNSFMVMGTILKME